MNIRGKNIVITGAANGIGKCLARQLHAKGAKLLLLDIDEIGLERVKDELGHDNVYCFVYNVGNYSPLCALNAHVLINNAGIGSGGCSMTTHVNFLGAVNLFERLQPNLELVVNVSSGQAFFKLPGWGEYAATKAALATWSETLNFEGTRTLTVYPFMTDTGFYKDIPQETWAGRLSMKLLPLYSQSPETVARKIVRAIERDKRVEMVHPINYLGKLLDVVPGLRAVVGTVASKLLVKGK